MGRKTKLNCITSPELLAQVNPKNTELMNDFLEYMRSVDKSPKTIDAYRSDLEIAMVWNLQNNGNKFFIDWTKRNIVAYQNWLINTNGNSPARVRRLKASLSSLSKYIETVLDDEFPTFRNIINKVESPVNQPVREKTVLTDEQCQLLLDTLVEKKQYDKACMFALALYSGRRKAELVRFKVSDFNEEHLVCGGALYKSSPMRTKGRGVNGKQLECFTLAAKFDPYLKLWMSYREDNGIVSDWLFPMKENMAEPMSPNTANSWAISFSKILGIDFYWHAVRHRSVTDLIRAGLPDTVVQQYFGWSDISMVPVYNDIGTDEQLSMYFNENGIVAPKMKSFSDI